MDMRLAKGLREARCDRAQTFREALADGRRAIPASKRSALEKSWSRNFGHSLEM
jgi:hypothetical protein